MHDRTRIRSILVLLVALAATPVAAQKDSLDLDWIFSPEGKTAAGLPDHIWLDTGLLLLYDTHPELTERTIESFDPGNGKREMVVDAARALAAFTEVLDEAPEELGWPDGFDPRGRWVVYEREDDIFLLDLKSSDLVTVAATDAVEKSARFSPDGKLLAFVRDNDLYVWDSEDRSERRLTHDGSETLLNGTVSWVYWEEIFGRNDLGYWWSPDSASIAFLQTDESDVGVVHFVDFKPNVPKVIRQRYPKTGEPNPKVRAGVIGLEEGKTTWVDLGRSPYEYLARVNWLPDSERLAVQTLDRAQTTLEIYLVDAGSGAASHLLRETDPGWVNLHDDLYFLEDDRFIWASERDGYSHLYLFAQDGSLIRQLTDGDWAIRASGGVFWQRQAVSFVDEKRGWVYFTSLAASSIERQLYRVRLEGSDPERITPRRGSHKILFRPDGKYFVDAFSAIDQLPELNLRATENDDNVVLAQPRPDLLKRFDLLPFELFSISAEDGFEMPAAMLKPRGFDPEKKYPVVIYVYGGPSAPTVFDAWGTRARDYFHHVLANAGFVVLLCDNRAATARSKTLENMITFDGYGKTELGDLLDAVKWLKSRPFVDPERVGIWGWSGGGSFTLLAMTGSKEFRAGIAVAAVTDWHYYDTKWAEAYMKRPQDNPEGYESTSHAKRADQLDGRLLLVHGTYDDNVHPQNAWRFTDELIEAGITFDMMIYPMRKHGISDDPAQKHLYRTMLEFWMRNLMP